MKNIYEPREDTFLLEKALKSYVKSKSVLEVGSGSGYLAEKSLDYGACSVLASDISNYSVKHIKSKGIPVVKSDLFSQIKQKFDVILFNPPYLPQNNNEDKVSQRATTGGKRGDEIILRFLKQVKKHLTKRGVVLILFSSLTPKDKIFTLLKKQNLSYSIVLSQSFFFETLSVYEIKA